MTTLHKLLYELTKFASDLQHLKMILQIVDFSNDAGEAELRAAINMSILHLSALETIASTNVDMLDKFLLDQHQ